MLRAVPLSCLSAALALTACERPPAGDTSRSPAPEIQTAAPPPAEPAAPAHTEAPRAPAAPDSGAEVLANVDRSCATDSDCTAIHEMYESDGHCCHSCNTDAVSTRWLERAVPVCSAMGGEGCPQKMCVALSKVTCRNGTCTVTKR